MKIVVDGMSGDKGTPEIVKGILLAISEMPEIEVIVTGQQDILNKEFSKYNGKYDKKRLSIVNADEVIKMTDDPVYAVRKKKNSSMNVGLDLVKTGVGEI